VIKRYGLIGFPLSHSFSKRYFSEKFEEEGLKDYIYELFPIGSIEKLPEIISSHPDLLGLNVTIPYKQQVIPFLHAPHLPEGVKACNCIKITNGKLHGYNTDVVGFENSFKPLLKPWHKNALVLGNGGATLAVVYVLSKLGIASSVISRKLHEGSAFTYDQLDKGIISENLVIINATPLGTYPRVEECPQIPYEYISDRHYLFDLVYNPSKTLFLKKGEERGALIKNGYDMLEIQAEESWKIWNEK
jgi:shikimate dehydrogenase